MRSVHTMSVCTLMCALIACSDGKGESSDRSAGSERPATVTPSAFDFSLADHAATAENPAQRFSVELTRSAVAVSLDDELDVTLTTAAIGRSKLGSVPAGKVRQAAQSMEIVRPGLREYFRNDPRGLEHGWVITERPAGGGELRIRVDVTGAWPTLRGKSVFLQRAGEPVLRYDRLVAWDARDRRVAARLEATGESIVVAVHDANAKYPVTIDPILSRVSQTSGFDSAADDQFGASAAIDGDTLVVGAPGADDGATDVGAVYVFRGSGAWTPGAKIVPSNPTAGQRFGASVAVAKDSAGNDILFVGAPGDTTQGTNNGAVYHLAWTGVSWDERDKFLAPSLGDDVEFGASVAVAGENAFAGAPGEFDGPDRVGGVHGFVQDPAAPGPDPIFILTDAIPPPTAEPDSAYGASLSYDSTGTLAVGAPGAGDVGTAHLFSATTSADDPLLFDVEVLASITPTDGAAGDRFGASVSHSAGRLVVGAPAHAGSGAAYLYGANVGGAGNWGRETKLTDALGASGDEYGIAVTIHGPMVAIGAPAAGAGAVTVFWKDEGGVDSWGLLSRETPPGGVSGDGFGSAVAATGPDLAIGAPAQSGTGQIHFLRSTQDPIALGDAYETLGSGTFTVGGPGLLENDSDPEGDPLTAIKVADPTNGSVVVNADGSFSYTPAGGFVGTDEFTYKANDGANDSNVATVTLVVPPDNSPPTTVNDSVSTPKDTPITIDVLANDSDPDGDPLTLVSVVQPSNGTAAINGDEVDYTPNAGYVGNDSFTYTVSDGTVDSSGSVLVDVTSTNQQPDAVNDFVSTVQGMAVTFDPTTNDTDAENDPLTVTNVETPVNGTVAQNGNQITYTPAPGFSGLDSFDYTISDGQGGQDTATITVGVNDQSDPPVANDDSFTVNENVSTLLDVLANDNDPDSAPTVDSVTQPANGSTAIVSNQVEYTPNMGFAGTDTFTYEITDGFNRDSATVTVTVLAVNDPPEFMAPTPLGTIREGAGTVISFRVYATDADANDTVTYGLQNPPPNSTFDTMTGDFQWATAPPDAGAHQLVFTATDGVNTVEHTVNVEIEFDDADGDGLSDGFERDNGLDPNNRDSDGDFISDGDEIGPDLANPYDTDGDMILDALDDDSDGDGILDADEAGDFDLDTAPVDTDGDGTPDARDTDSDGDGATDDVDNCRLTANADQSDLDGDGEGDACDTDDDGDGVPDQLEQSLGLDPANIDTDGDTISDGDEVAVLGAPSDADGDGTIDALDDDSDDDGVPDADEAGDDDPDTPPVDTDGDRVPDFRDTDSDGDSIPDGEDNCRLDVNPAQADMDGDGVGDVCDDGPNNDADGDGVANNIDNCPDVANPNQSDIDDDDLGDACDDDIDGDGVPNADDNCPDVPNPDQANSGDDEEGDACDTDQDDDGIDDDEDNCPDTPNPAQTDVDGDGDGDACDPPVGTNNNGGLNNGTGPGNGDEGCCKNQTAPGTPSPAAVLLLLGFVIARRFAPRW